MLDADLFNLLAQLLVLAAAGFVGCYIAQRVGTARIVGGLIAGLIVGPSLLGKVAPDAERWLWRGAAAERVELAQIEADYASAIKASIASGVSEIHQEILQDEYGPLLLEAQRDMYSAINEHRRRTSNIAAIAIIMILLAVGRHAPLQHVRSQLSRAVAIAIAAPVLPTICFCAAYWLRLEGEQLIPASIVATALALAAMALPISSRLTSSRQEFHADDNDGIMIPVARHSAAICSAAIFVGVAVVLAPPTEPITDFSRWIPIPPIAISLTVLIAGFAAVLAVAFFGLRLIRNDRNDTPDWPVGLLLIAAMLPIVGAAYAGVPVALGALAAGLALGALSETPALIRRGFAHLADAIALPILCAYIGTRIDIVPQFDWPWVLIAILLFGDGKAIGVMLVGRFVCRLDWRASLRMGTILAAGGALPLIVALMVYEAGAIDDQLFVALVIANAVTAALAAPTLRMIGAYFDAKTSESPE